MISLRTILWKRENCNSQETEICVEGAMHHVINYSIYSSVHCTRHSWKVVKFHNHWHLPSLPECRCEPGRAMYRYEICLAWADWRPLTTMECTQQVLTVFENRLRVRNNGKTVRVAHLMGTRNRCPGPECAHGLELTCNQTCHV